MARVYSLEVQRGLVNAILYYHDDGTLELVDADSGEHVEYLQIKLNLAKDLFNWMSKYNVDSFECIKV
mgnify:FL=1